MVALYELFLTVLGRDKLTPAVAELLLLLTSKSEVNNILWSGGLENCTAEENPPGVSVEGGCSAEGAGQQPPLHPRLLGR